MLLERHRSKIVQSSQLPALLGARPRARTVVMCCGVFDVVHPGHLRHLLYAKSKADVLVAAVTGDAHVPKGPYRPHVPQDLRAANLSVYDFVDYVVISDSPSVSELLASAQPDFYAKGFEYSNEARAKPIEEVAVVEGYGGQVIYTPGDVVYSSSALIEASAPDLRYEKLAMLMRRLDISFDRLRATVAEMVGQRVHVVGDTIVDSLQYCEMIGAQAKTPTISVRREHREDYVGGAGVVAKHMRAAGAIVHFTTVLGGDQRAVMVLDDLGAAGIHVNHVVDALRPTTCKEAVVVDGYRLLKIDDVDNRSIAGRVLEDVRGSIAEIAAAAVIFSDFRHGIFNARTIPVLAGAIDKRTPLRVADSQVASRWGNITEFAGFDFITPNEREARFALADQDSGVRPLAARLQKEAQCRWLLMKMGQRGVLGFGEGPDDSIAVDSFAKSATDPVGAGDAFLSYATLAMLAGGGLAQAAILGTFAAGAECECDGNIPITPEYVLSKIDEAEREIG
jgi:cytidyltransferase-like protein